MAVTYKETLNEMDFNGKIIINKRGVQMKNGTGIFYICRKKIQVLKRK